ncbi:MAG: hypothetical protein ACE5JE_01620 [Thermoplasmata archaeon]
MSFDEVFDVSDRVRRFWKTGVWFMIAAALGSAGMAMYMRLVSAVDLWLKLLFVLGNRGILGWAIWKMNLWRRTDRLKEVAAGASWPCRPCSESPL